METIDVEHDGIHRHIAVMLVVHPDIAEEVVEVKQIRQAVAFSGLDDVALFRKLDTPVDTGHDDLKGRTVSVKTNLYKENDIAFVYEGTYNTNNVLVTIGYLYDDNGDPLTDFDYKKGDTIVLEVHDVAFRGTKNGKIREYYINTVLPDKQ